MDVAAWLGELGLERYEGAFRDNEIDGEVLPTLTAEDLKDLGVAAIGHRRKLLNAIAALAEPETPPEPAAAPRAEAERRQLTVMFCDLVGSTALSAQLDPEDMREVIRSYQDACAGVITRFEGFVAKYMGDGVLAYFGYPRAHEDDAERAVRAGLALTEAVAKLATPTDQALAARIGIATGLVVVGDLVGEGASQEQAVVGDTPNLAARLQGVAEPGQVVIAEATRRLLGAGFDLEDLGVRELKGLAGPIGAFAVRGERAVESRFEARSAQVLPMVGRDQELALLLERWTQAKASEGQGVLLVAEAGIGKSRIVRALLDRVAKEPHVRVRYQCSPYHTESALWPVIQQLGHAAGIAVQDGVDVRLDKLEALLARAGDAVEALPLIASLIGVDGEDRYGSLGLTPQAQRARTLEALTQQMLGLAAARPVLVLLEDAHWIDPTTLEMIGQALDRIADARVLIVLTSRPDHQPELAAHPHVTRLTLNRLSRSGAEAIVARLGGAHLSSEVIDTIVARTDGVPLFVEELTKAILETGESTIPATLHDSLMARLDRIPEVKEVAQIAACIGREFDLSLLASIADLSEPDLLVALDRLASAELIFRRGTPPDARYTFKHALVQDTAYASLLRSRRQATHRRIAEVLERRSREQDAGAPELVARHFTEAERPFEAIPYWQQAGEHAVRRSANHEAIAHLSQAIRLLEQLPPTPERRHGELRLLTTIAGPLIAAKGYGAAETAKAFGRAQQLAEEVEDPTLLFPTLYGQWVYKVICAEHAASLQLAQNFVRLSAGQTATGSALVAQRVLGVSLFETGATTEAKNAFEHALSLYDPDEHGSLKFSYGQDPRSAGLSFLGCVLFELGFPDQARASVDAAVAHAEALNHANTMGYALTYGELTLHSCLRDAPAVAQATGRLKTVAETFGMSLWLAYARVFQGWALAMQDRAAEGLRSMRQGLDALEATGTMLHRAHGLGMLAQALHATGAHADALHAIDEALALAQRQHELWFEPELYRIKGALLQEQDATAAAHCFERAIAVARGRKTRSWELRATTSLAQLWAEQGEGNKGYDLLAPIHAWFTEGFDTPDLIEAKALLEALR